MEHTGTEKRRLVEKVTLSERPTELVSRIGWTTFSASFGACLGVAMSSQSGWSLPGWSLPGWSLLLSVAFIPLLSVTVVLFLWFAMRRLGMWVVNMAWRDWHSDPCGTAPVCPECDEIWGPQTTQCCGASTFGVPPRNRDGHPYCPDCKDLNPIYECCGKAWIKECGTYIDGHGIMTDQDWKRRPAMWQDWRPSIRDVGWSLSQKYYLNSRETGDRLFTYLRNRLSRSMRREGRQGPKTRSL